MNPNDGQIYRKMFLIVAGIVAVTAVRAALTQRPGMIWMMAACLGISAVVLLGLSMGCESKRERIQAEGKRFEGVIVGYRREQKGRGVDYHYIIEYRDGETTGRCETGGMRTKWDQRLPSAEVEVYISGSEVVVCTQDQVPYGQGVRLMRLN